MIKRYFNTYKLSILGSQFFKLLEAILELMIPIFVAEIVNYGLTGRTERPFYFIIGKVILMVLFCTLGFAFAMICQYYASKTSENIGRDIRRYIYKKLKTTNIVESEKYTNEEMIFHMTVDVERIQLLVAMYIRLFVRAPFLFIGSFIICLIINLQLSLIILFVILIMCLLVYISYKVLPSKIEKVQNSIENILKFSNKTILGSVIIRIFLLRKKWEDEFNKTVEQSYSLSRNAGITSAIFEPIINVALYIGYFLILLLGAIFFFNGEINKGDIVAYTGYMTSIIYSWTVMIRMVPILMNGITSIKRIESLTSADDIKGGTITNVNIENIILKDVNFKYSSQNVLNNINLHINRGDKIGIIGGTGSGKSTLIKLITNQLKPTDGEVLYNSIKSFDFDYNCINRSFCICSKKSDLISDSIYNNFKLANEDLSEYEVMKVLNSINSDDILKKGLDYEIVDQGTNLSGGQKQRLILARTILSKGEFKIFDDTFSALDNLTSVEIINYLMRIKSSILIASQKIEHIRRLNKIIVLNNGYIVGSGNHEQLVKNCKTYFEIVESQKND